MKNREKTRQDIVGHQKYIEELQSHKEDLKRLKVISKSQNLTLLYASKVPNINNASVLLEVLNSLK